MVKEIKKPRLIKAISKEEHKLNTIKSNHKLTIVILIICMFSLTMSAFQIGEIYGWFKGAEATLTYSNSQAELKEVTINNTIINNCELELVEQRLDLYLTWIEKGYFTREDIE